MVHLTFRKYALKSVGRLPRPRSLLFAANLVAVFAILAIVVGPALSHHYAELSPFHTHIYYHGITPPGHTHTFLTHTHSNTGDAMEVVSVSDHTAASSTLIDLVADVSHELRPEFISSVEPVVTELGDPQRFIRPPERPPQYS